MKVKLVSESNFTVKEHGVHTAFLATKKMLEEQGVDVIVNSYEKADITHIHSVGPYSLTHLLKDKKVVVSAHVIPASFRGSLILTKYWIEGAENYLRFFYNKASLVLAVAPKVSDVLKSIGVKTRVEIFPNPIDTKTFKKDAKIRNKIRTKHNFGESDFIVLSVGQVQSRKGVNDFLETAKKLPKIKFVWIGGKPFGKLTQIDKDLKENFKIPLQNVLFLGTRKVEEMPDYYNIADVFFLPSLQENAPMSVLEAGATELPLVLRNLQEYKWLYKDGFISSEKNDFVGIISNLEKDAKLRTKASEDASKLVDKFSFEVLGPKLIKLYEKI